MVSDWSVSGQGWSVTGQWVHGGGETSGGECMG